MTETPTKTSTAPAEQPITSKLASIRALFHTHIVGAEPIQVYLLRRTDAHQVSTLISRGLRLTRELVLFETIFCSL